MRYKANNAMIILQEFDSLSAGNMSFYPGICQANLMVLKDDLKRSLGSRKNNNLNISF
jgi:hypothetical protein